MKKTNLNYPLNSLAGKPHPLNDIKTRLMKLKRNDILTNCIVRLASIDVTKAIAFILSQGKDNPKVMIELIGQETMDLIKNFMEK